jgi:2-polyprenyl-6-hydroxyphenyl methylase/3-demethylubiquinone-9 3-methyltransferase
MSGHSLLEVESHFKFGKNWKDFSKGIDAESLEEAKRGLRRLFPGRELQGASFLDIGSGSGLHSVAASELGAREIIAIDIDEDSVDTTRRTLARYGITALVERRSVFEADNLGQFDVVYSWGVLHHTGDMWRAIHCAAQHVKPGGLLALALYQKRVTCAAWVVEKRFYTKCPRALQALIRGIYGAALLLGVAISGRNPIRYYRGYKSSRGMSFWHDVHDWLGGYPYESSTPEETCAFVENMGFEPAMIAALKKSLGLFGTGCAEYVFRRRPVASMGE